MKERVRDLRVEFHTDGPTTEKARSANRRIKSCLCKYFWFLVCDANVNNFKSAQPLIGGHKEVRTKVEIAHRHTIANFCTAVTLHETMDHSIYIKQQFLAIYNKHQSMLSVAGKYIFKKKST